MIAKHTLSYYEVENVALCNPESLLVKFDAQTGLCYRLSTHTLDGGDIEIANILPNQYRGHTKNTLIVCC